MNFAQGAVVVGVDGSVQATDAVRWAAAEAAGRGAPLHLVHAMAFPPALSTGYIVPQELLPELRRQARSMLDEAVRIAHEVAGDQVEVNTAAPVDYPDQVLVEMSAVARMVVVGVTGRGGFTGMLVGSTADAVACHAHCPVAVIRGRDGVVPPSGRVVVGIDEWPPTEAAIAVAFDQASRRGAPLLAVHAWSVSEYLAYLPGGAPGLGESLADEHRRLVSERLAGWQEKYPDVSVAQLSANDRPHHQLLYWSGQAQLVVVGSHGRGRATGTLMGSVSRAMVYHARCPVLVVRKGHHR